MYLNGPSKLASASLVMERVGGPKVEEPWPNFYVFILGGI